MFQSAAFFFSAPLSGIAARENLLPLYRDWQPDNPSLVTYEPSTNLVGPLLLATQRHTLWLKKIESAFAKGGVLVAVGLAHLDGHPDRPSDPTLLSLLKRDGYQVSFDNARCAKWLN